jgi:hypothetical protein
MAYGRVYDAGHLQRGSRGCAAKTATRGHELRLWATAMVAIDLVAHGHYCRSGARVLIIRGLI